MFLREQGDKLVTGYYHSCTGYYHNCNTAMSRKSENKKSGYWPKVWARTKKFLGLPYAVKRQLDRLRDVRKVIIRYLDPGEDSILFFKWTKCSDQYIKYSQYSDYPVVLKSDYVYQWCGEEAQRLEEGNNVKNIEVTHDLYMKYR